MLDPWAYCPDCDRWFSCAGRDDLAAPPCPVCASEASTVVDGAEESVVTR